MESNESGEKRSYWMVFYDDIYLLFFLSAAITFILYTVWGLIELGTVPVSPYLTAGSAVSSTSDSNSSASVDTAAVEYWKKWEKGTVGQFPPCGTNVIALGLDEILQGTVDTYCGLDPGHYETWINPAKMDTYRARGTTYADGPTGVLVLPKLGVAFTTAHKSGNPIYDAITVADGKSIASSESGHPLNPETCSNCHATYDGVCVGFVCGNRND